MNKIEEAKKHIFEIASASYIEECQIEEVTDRLVDFIFDDVDSEICENCHYSVNCSIQTQIMQTSFSCLECCDGEDYERYSSKPSCNLFKRKEE